MITTSVRCIFIILILVLFLPQYVPAQKTKILKFDPISVKAASPVFGQIMVIDTRPDTTIHGFVVSNSNREIAPVITEKPLSDELTAFYKQVIGLNSSNASTLLINLRKFIISETAGMSETGKVSIMADSYVGENGQYRWIDRMDTTIVIKGNQVTSRLLAWMKINLGKWMGQLQAVQASTNSTIFTLNEIMAHEGTYRNNLPLFSQPLKKGFYANYEALLNNQPEITLFEVQPKPNGKDSLYFDLTSNAPKAIALRNQYAYYDGGRLWIWQQGKKRMVLKKEGDWYTIARVDQSNSNSAAFGMGMFFGIVGGTIAAISATSGEFGPAWFAFRWNYQTGLLIPALRIGKTITPEWIDLAQSDDE